VPGIPDNGVLVDANKYFHPFRLACESKSARIVQTAVDGLQKLMACVVPLSLFLARVQDVAAATQVHK
jgi:hypothetical protein